MKKIITATALTVAMAAPAFAQLTDEQVAKLLAMSNSSAAEQIVRDTGEPTDGNPVLAEMKFALGEMSAAERQTFFEADDSTRMELIAAKRKLAAGTDSPAESN